MKITNCIYPKLNGKGLVHHQIQIGGIKFYAFLRSRGLTPRKSLTVGRLRVDSVYFHDFLRGVIDGDGSIRSWRHPTNQGIQWSLRIYSGSLAFFDWLKSEIDLKFHCRGAVHKNSSRHFVLKFGKMAAQQILGNCYYEDCFGLKRKIQLASRCINAANGWKISGTIGQVAETVYATDSQWVSLEATPG